MSTGPALFSVVCHCRDCQRASGTGGVPVLGVPRESFSCSGPVKQSKVVGGSGYMAVRNFCSECGSLLFGTPESAPEMVTIYAGSLDDSSLFSPTDAIFVSQRKEWAVLAQSLNEHHGLPK
ncbi:GFA family protein [Cellvibrio sp.]|uniref:GFA family protein n=1 Tax=Cellvibrio sp. TaxID=1965322 RepID=UPI0039648194